MEQTLTSQFPLSLYKKRTYYYVLLNRFHHALYN
nr:MAG TPA: hypothetical protein [Caudoviricetes sp.]